MILVVIKKLSAGTIWYKMQPDSEIARAIGDLLTDFCGSIMSHDATVQPQKLVSLTKKTLSRSDTVIVVGGLDAIAREENIVFLLSKALGVPLEQGKRSRSRYIFDTLHHTRLPSLAGSVLFPSRFDGPEGILLMSGAQTVIVLPAMTRMAVTVAVSMRKFLAPYAVARRNAKTVQTEAIRVPKHYGKFRPGSDVPRIATREYSEKQLQTAMEHAVRSVRRHGRCVSSDETEDDVYEDEFAAYYQNLSFAGRWRNILSLILVLGVIVAFIILLFLNGALV